VKVVLDTNVFVSGVFFSGPPYQILEALRDGQIELAISLDIPAEYRRGGEIYAADHPEGDLNPILDFPENHFDIVSAPLWPQQVCKDPSDDKFPACALASRCRVVVSGDKHLLQISGYRGIEVLKPREFLTKYITGSSTIGD